MGVIVVGGALVSLLGARESVRGCYNKWVGLGCNY